MLSASLRRCSGVSLAASKYASSLGTVRMMSTPNLTKEEINRYLTTPPYTIPNKKKIIAPPMVYISGEEMTRYTMELM